MSRAVAYTPPEYIPPEMHNSSWQHVERRSHHPVNSLSRSLNVLCLEASDSYEIVAHLEALGYNRPEILARLGVGNHFQLAHLLFEMTPRRNMQRAIQVRSPVNWLTPLAIGAAFLVTLLLGAYDTTAMLLPAIVILTWSQVGSSLLSKAQAEVGAAQQAALVSLLVWFGAVAVGTSWFLLRFDMGTFAPTLIWFTVASLLWARQPRRALSLPLIVGCGILFDVLAGGRTTLPYSLAIAASAVYCVPLLIRPGWIALDWLRNNLSSSVYPFAYGAAQGALLIVLLRGSEPGSQILPGALLLLGILLTSEHWLVVLKDRLKRQLWSAARKDAYGSFAQRAVLGHAAVYLLPLLAALLIQLSMGLQPWMFHWYAFALFGLCLGLAVFSFTLGDPVSPSVSFLLAAVAAVAGAPFLAVVAAAAAIEILLLLYRVRQVERYAAFLL